MGRLLNKFSTDSTGVWHCSLRNGNNDRIPHHPTLLLEKLLNPLLLNAIFCSGHTVIKGIFLLVWKGVLVFNAELRKLYILKKKKKGDLQVDTDLFF